MKNNITRTFTFCLILIAIFAFAHVRCCRESYSYSVRNTYADTLIVIDTIPFYVPVAYDSLVVRYVTDTLPAISRDSVRASKMDSASVRIPIVQKIYSTEQYRAYVSGYRPSLDSLFIYESSRVIEIRDRPRRWGVGVQIGYGVGIASQQVKTFPYIGVGITYSLVTF